MERGELLRNPPVRAVMTESPVSVSTVTSISRAWTLMQEHRIRHLPVVDGDRVVGILSDRDLHLVKTMRGVDPDDVGVDETMVRDPFTLSPDVPLAEAARRMAELKVGSAVVVSGGKPIGIFTTTDALRALAVVLEG